MGRPARTLSRLSAPSDGLKAACASASTRVFFSTPHPSITPTANRSKAATAPCVRARVAGRPDAEAQFE